jgi:hypothetical protein
MLLDNALRAIDQCTGNLDVSVFLDAENLCA